MGIWNIGNFNDGSHGWIEPGSRYGIPGANPKGQATDNSGSFWDLSSAMGGGPQHAPLMSGMPGEVGIRDFGIGGIWNDMNIPGVAAGTQGQPSGGFNTPFGTSLLASPNSSIPGGSSFGNFNFGGNSFSANGTTPQNPFSFFGGSTGGIPGGSSMFSGLPQISGKDLDKIYGKGVGGALAAFLNSGAGFNPAVIQAQQNAARPLEARGIENIMNAMGGHGLGMSSSAAIGLGDFESQFNAQLQSIFAQEYENSVSNYLNVLMGVKGDAKEHQAQSSNWMSILSGLVTQAIPFFS
jgi:hypothetical protein